MNIFVVLVTYNAKKFINTTLKNIEKLNTIANIICIDNNSTDDSFKDICNTFNFHKTIKLNNNIGFGKANNIGMKIAYKDGADYVFLINQDAYISASDLEKIIVEHSKNSKYGILSPIHLNGAGDGIDVGFFRGLSCSDVLLYDFLTKKPLKNIYDTDFVNAAAWLISRKCLETIGCFDPVFFHYGEDNEYCKRALSTGFKIGVLPSCFAYHDRKK